MFLWTLEGHACQFWACFGNFLFFGIFWVFGQKLINSPFQFDESSREEDDTDGCHNSMSSSPAIFRAFEDHSPPQIGEKQPHFAHSARPISSLLFSGFLRTGTVLRDFQRSDWGDSTYAGKKTQGAFKRAIMSLISTSGRLPFASSKSGDLFQA